VLSERCSLEASEASTHTQAETQLASLIRSGYWITRHLFGTTRSKACIQLASLIKLMPVCLLGFFGIRL
jgi:hypothetical protein